MVHVSRKTKTLKMIVEFLSPGFSLSVPERLRKEYVSAKVAARIAGRKMSIDELLSSAGHSITLWGVARKNGAEADKMFLLQAEILGYVAVIRERRVGTNGAGNTALEVFATATA